MESTRERRDFLLDVVQGLACALLAGACGRVPLLPGKTAGGEYDPSKHNYGMGIQVDKCIGCGRCVEACKEENNVPRDPFFFRTWVERVVIRKKGTVTVQNIDRGQAMVEPAMDKDILRSFFVPKLCNQCDNPPCVQVCPVGATFKTEDGAILVDENRCVGRR